jgi:hypothetical protein
MNLEAWQITVWMAAILVAMFASGCTFGYAVARNKHTKRTAHAHPRKR